LYEYRIVEFQLLRVEGVSASRGFVEASGGDSGREKVGEETRAAA
jgi:hypothetical protein